MNAAREGRGIGLVCALLLGSVLVVAACDRLALSAPVAEVTGLVTKVEGRNAAQVDRFVIRTAEGSEVEFRVGDLRVDANAFPAAHLSEHLVTLEPVRVEYVERDGARVAVRLSDAVAP